MHSLPEPAAPRATAPAGGGAWVRRAAMAPVGAAAMLAGFVALGLNWWLGPALWVSPLSALLGVVAAAVLPGLLGARQARRSHGADAAPPGALLAADGVPRELFMELAHREWARARRYGSGAALLVVEVDRHSRLLETRGSAASEAVLQALLRHTAPTLRGADVLTRLTPSQIAVFLAPADATGALDVAERIRERTEQLEVPVHPQRLRCTVSVGVAHLRAAHLHLQALVDDAVAALAVAREAGGNCVRAAPIETPGQTAAGAPAKGNRTRPI